MKERVQDSAEQGRLLPRANAKTRLSSVRNLEAFHGTQASMQSICPQMNP